jgi:uncharacterized membrane protein HdeD (DUF308 family)
MAGDTKAVFISYRRDESAGYAGRIADSFVEHFGEDKVFRDLDSLEPGLDFAEAIERAIESSEVLIAVIGKNWLTATDAAGRKRLEYPDDYVRKEITTALRRNIRVIPLLVQDAPMPSPTELPEDLAPLSRRNAFELHDSSWRDDIRRLVATLDRVINRNRPPKPDEPGVVQELARRVTAIYAEGQRHMHAREWQQALECFEEIQRLEPGFRETEALLSRVRRELAPPPTLLPALTGSWWAMSLRGLVIVIFGLLLLLMALPGPFPATLRLYIALMPFADGMVARIDAKARAERRGPLTIQSRISFLIGFLVWLVWLIRDVLPHQNPLLSSLDEFFANHSVAPRLVGIWAIIIGSIRIFAAIQLRWETTNLRLMAFSGASLAVFGFLLLPRPSDQYPAILLIPLTLVSGIALMPSHYGCGPIGVGQ